MNIFVMIVTFCSVTGAHCQKAEVLDQFQDRIECIEAKAEMMVQARISQREAAAAAGLSPEEVRLHLEQRRPIIRCLEVDPTKL